MTKEYTTSVATLFALPVILVLVVPCVLLAIFYGIARFAFWSESRDMT